MSLIYCVEDDDGIRELVSCALKAGGYEVTAFSKAKPFYDAMKIKAPSLILLDIMLPDEDGMTILRKIKSDALFKSIPVIMLTAKTSELDKVAGLESGADDYISKPFGVMELLSRIKAVLRRSKRLDEQSELLVIGNISLDASKRIVTCNEKEVILTYKEFEILMYLMKNQSIVISRDRLMEKVWGFEFAGETRTVDMHIKTIRRKLESAGCENFIKTVRGVGYKV